MSSHIREHKHLKEKVIFIICVFASPETVLWLCIQACDTSTWEVDAGGSEVQGQAGLPETIFKTKP